MKMNNWIWLKGYIEHHEPVTILFRKAFSLTQIPEDGSIRITADTRYKLYINGTLVETGPSRGDDHVWFYDDVNVSSYLRVGENVIAVHVLRMPEDTNHANHGMFRTKTPGLYVDSEFGLFTDDTWKAREETGRKFYREEIRFAPLNIHEIAKGDTYLLKWKDIAYDDTEWEYAEVVDVVDVLKDMKPRTIPFMKRIPGRFASIVRQDNPNDYLSLIRNDEEVVIPAETTEIVEISNDVEMTGYIHLAMSGGTNAKIELLYSEAYVQEGTIGPERIPIKTNRMDCIHGHLSGYTDTYTVAGNQYEVYEPYWLRTFRFIRMTITTSKEPLVLHRFTYEETGYPLDVKTHVETSDPTMPKIWEISERTLRRCMHESYFDCPFYEQLQYVMDSRLQILYTYATSADDRLARKCIDDLSRGQREDGLLNCSYPNRTVNVIPTFSLYFIMMVYDHMMYFGDKELVVKYMPVIERILGFFKKHTTQEGYVEKTGGPNGQQLFWSFIDWAAQWNDMSGVPTAIEKGPITMETLLYVYGLQHAQALAEYIGRDDLKGTWKNDEAKAKNAVKSYCMDEDGVITDGPGVHEYSQHCQVFGVLTGILEENAREVLKKTINDLSYAQCTVAMRYYLFRAMEKTGLYELTDHYYDAWRTMLKNHVTTCVESEAYARSECHAWGSLVLYELPSITLGVRPAMPGYEKILIKPIKGYMHHAKGDVITPKGMVHVEWDKDHLNYTAPEGIEVIVEEA